MKKLNLICSALALMIAFSIPVLAGDQGTPARTAPGDQHGPALSTTGDQHGPARTLRGEVSSQAGTAILLALDLIF